ncbi:uncharacterized protein ACLA_054300 [Aspergillus clavatus NRRL 1]|uniref:Conserved serine-threonine rich protein n=1 Tax=Aspergillus clavatus (strain ATCC 1007 / CBS 513.65 / DSM 816 / NCTC 3887 / NRRL 1 / QM 1276 / 107) TaxID=344612 RepID=A1C959_ASPCL|nr:conserved serine-threonine rich protein [Aspergillus clavatus NRRL 1]EAW13383.1 conserved serine-threonine rich protein [Aspergillus clavatus NRRL 1]
MGYNALISSSYSRALCKRPQTTSLASNRATSITSPPIRGLWRYSYHRRESRSPGKGKLSQRHTWHDQSRLQDQASRFRRRSRSESDRHHSWQNLGLGWGVTKSSFPGRLGGFWEAQRVRTQQRIEQIKKEIDADPYRALFGRRLEPFNFGGKHGGIFASMIQSFLGRGQRAESNPRGTDTTAEVKAADRPSERRAGDSQTSTISKGEDTPGGTLEKDANADYVFDPISGRMIPRKAKGFNEPEKRQTAQEDDSADMSTRKDETSIDNAGFLSSIARSKNTSKTNESIRSENKEGSKEILRPMETHLSETLTKKGAPPHNDTHKHNLGHPEKPVYDGMTRSYDESLPFREAVPNSQAEPRHEQTLQYTPTEIHETDQIGKTDKSDGMKCAITPSISPEISSASRAFRDVEQSDAWITRAEKEEDLDLLRASDIRATYALEGKGRKTDMQDREKRGNLELAFESYQDPVKDLDAQSIRAKYQPLSESTLPEHLPLSAHSGSTTQGSPETPLSCAPTVSQDASELIGGLGEQSHGIQAPRICSSAAVYRLLVYDPFTMQVIEAETKSSQQSEGTPLSPVEVLSRLNHPARFVPYLAKMDEDGFEIVSGGGDIIFFKQAVTGCSDPQSKPSNSGPRQEDNMAESPTSSNSSPYLPVSNQTSSDRLHSNTSSRDRAVLRGILISGIATVATCYAIGVVVEYFRTGGQDGLGIDGFTEFESERRHRDRE